MSTEIATITEVEEIKGTLVRMQDNFAHTLPAHIKPERFVSVAQMAIVNNPALAKCDRNSLYIAFTQCAQDGLYPDGREAAIVPFAGKGKYMVMVAGICKKARNSGEIQTLDAQVVYENDEYEQWSDERGAHFKFVRARENRGKPILTFAYAIAKDGGVYFEEIDEDQMKAIEAKSRASDSPWKGPFRDEMRRKSAIRRLGKYRLPNSADLDTLFKHDDEIYEENPVEVSPEKTSPTRLEGIVEAQGAQEAPKSALKPAPLPPKPPAAAAAAQKPASPPVKQGTTFTIKGKIEDMKVQSNQPESPKKWTRYACKVDGKFFGTFDKPFGDLIVKAMDAGQEVTVTYKERTEENKIYRDIVSLTVDQPEESEGEPVSESDVPI